MTRRENRVHPATTFLALLLWAAGTHGAGAADPQAPYFVDVAAAAGMSHAYTGDWTHYVGGGVAAFDCDLDGDPDLFFAGGASPSTLYRNDSAPGTLRFSAVVGSALVETGVTGAYPLDIDGDGTMDLAVLRLGANRLYRGLGECRFADAGEAWGVPGGDAWTTAFSAVWEGDNRLPTLAFGNYVDRDLWAAMHTPFGDSGTGAAPTPACPDNVLFRPADVDAATYAPAIGLSPGHCPLSMLFSDWSRAGRPDLRVSNDRFYHEDTGEEQLWRLGTEALGSTGAPTVGRGSGSGAWGSRATTSPAMGCLTTSSPTWVRTGCARSRPAASLAPNSAKSPSITVSRPGARTRAATSGPPRRGIRSSPT